MHQVKVNDKQYQIASCWKELTDKQLFKVAPVIFCLEESPVNKWQVLMSLLPLPVKTRRKLSMDQKYNLLQLTSWLWKEPMNDCPIKDFEFAGVRYLLPNQDFSNVVMIEYAMADHYLRRFLAKPTDTTYLDYLISTICRPKKKVLASDPDWDGDYREKYNAEICKDAAKSLHHLPMVMKIILLQYFVNCQRKFTEKYKQIFDRKEEGSGQPVFNIGYLALIYDLAEQKLFGDFDKTCFTPVDTVFLYLLKKKFDNLQIK